MSWRPHSSSSIAWAESHLQLISMGLTVSKGLWVSLSTIFNSWCRFGFWLVPLHPQAHAHGRLLEHMELFMGVCSTLSLPKASASLGHFPPVFSSTELAAWNQPVTQQPTSPSPMSLGCASQTRVLESNIFMEFTFAGLCLNLNSVMLHRDTWSRSLEGLLNHFLNV